LVTQPNPDHILSTSEPKASRAKLHLAAPDRVIWLVVAAIVLWGVWAFGSELMLNLRLNQEVQQLRDGNAQLSAANDQTRKELSVAGSPGSMEEAARKAGFSKPGEQVYVIVRPSDAASSAAVGETAKPSPVAASGRQPAGETAAKHDGGVIGGIEEWWRNLWH
jgi:cell division protein FtsB